MRGVPLVIHGAGIAKGCLISRGGGFGQYKRLPPAQGSSFDHLHFSSPLSTAQQGKLDFAICLSFGILCSPGLLQGCLVWDWTLQKILGSRIGFGDQGLVLGCVLDWFWILSGRTSAGQNARSAGACPGIQDTRHLPGQFGMDLGIRKL